MTFEVGIVFVILAITVTLFVTERLRVDVVALLAMASLLVSGFASNP